MVINLVNKKGKEGKLGDSFTKFIEEIDVSYQHTIYLDAIRWVTKCIMNGSIFTKNVLK